MKSRVRMRKGERARRSQTPSPPQRAARLPARPSPAGPDPGGLGEVHHEIRGRGTGAWLRERALLQAPRPCLSLPSRSVFPKVHPIQLPTRILAPRTLSGAGTGPVPRSRPQHRPGNTARPRLTSSAHPPFCDRGGDPSPRADRVGGESCPSSLGDGSCSRAEAWVGEGPCRGGAGARRSGGSRALSARDGPGRAGHAHPPATPRPLHQDCAPLLGTRPRPASVHRPTQTWLP